MANNNREESMEENPYQEPNSDVNAVIENPAHDKVKLKGLANGQKLVIYAVLLYFIAVAVRELFLPATFLLIILCFGMSLVGLFKIVKVLEIHITFKVLYFIMLFIPLINILALLSLNSKATKILKAGGYRVGFMGAKAVDS